MAQKPTTAKHRPEVALDDVVAALKQRYPPPEPLTDPLELILWENMGYLIDDDRRGALFEEFRERVGFDAKKIDKAPKALLGDIAARGGMKPEMRIERWRETARLVLNAASGDLAAHLRALPVTKARALLKLFPVIGDPGADKILLFSNLDVRPALDSNGLRVMLRLGAAAVGSSYGASYRNAVTALAKVEDADRAWFMDAYAVLQAHGRTLCKRTAADCLPCPLDPICAHVVTSDY
jgi:endonuclease-3